MSVRALTDLFAAWLDDAAQDTDPLGASRLERLLRLRPDLCSPPPSDLGSLAARALAWTSLGRALDGLDLTHLQVLESVAAVGLSTLEQIAAFLGVPDHPEIPDDVLHHLQDLAVVSSTGPQGAWSAPAQVTAAVGNLGLHLGRPAAGLGADPSELPSTSDEVIHLVHTHGLVRQDPGLRAAVLHGLDALQTQPVARVSEHPGPVLQVLLDTGLLVRAGTAPDGTAVAEHPLEAALAWRNGTAGVTLSLAPPDVPGQTVLGPVARNAALSAVTDLLRECVTVLAALEYGLPTLRSGGVGVREVRRLAARTGTDPTRLAWLVELLVAAGLVELDPDTSQWEHSSAVPHWRRASRAQQWEVLVSGWLSCARAPLWGPAVSTAQASPAESGRLLAPDRTRPDAPHLRATVLGTAARASEQQPGIGLDAAVPHRLRWQHPRQHHRTAPFVPALLREAGLLGLTGAGALTELGERVAGSDLDGARDALEQLLPAPVTRFRLQGDLTAVAPGYLDPRLAEPLLLMATPEGEGPAQQFRFSDESLHRALDSGWTAEQILGFLTEHSEDQVPQAVEYLVRDVARRHGALVTGAAAAWLRAEDPDLLDAVLADPALAQARLERLAPTVLVAGVGPRELQRLLAASGHRAALAAVRPALPAASAAPPPDGGQAPSADTSPQRGHPSSTVARSPFPSAVTPTRRVPSDQEIQDLLERLRRAPVVRDAGAGPEQAVAVLRHAARTRQPVRLLLVTAQGERRERLVIPLAVAGGRLRCQGLPGPDGAPEAGVETVLPLHRVAGAVPVTASDS